VLPPSVSEDGRHSLERRLSEWWLLVADSRWGRSTSGGSSGGSFPGTGYRCSDSGCWTSPPGSSGVPRRTLSASSVTSWPLLLDARTHGARSDTEGNPALSPSGRQGSTLYVASMCGLSLKQTGAGNWKRACRNGCRSSPDGGEQGPLPIFLPQGKTEKKHCWQSTAPRQADSVNHDSRSGPVTYFVDGTTHTIQD
jgi:hypothetical protein